MESSGKEPKVIDYESESDEDFSDAFENPIENPQDYVKTGTNSDTKNPHDEFFDVPEWRESKKDEQKSDNEDPESETEATKQDAEEQQLKERLEREEKLTPEEKESLKSKAVDLKKAGNELYLAGENSEAVKKYTEALETCPLSFKVSISDLQLFLKRCFSSTRFGIITRLPDFITTQ